MAADTSRMVRLALTATLMALAANCFLKYLWWAACYSAWSGIPKMAEQWKAAGARATFNGWSFILLELASVAVLFTAIRLRQANFPSAFRTALRATAALTLTIIGTGLL